MLVHHIIITHPQAHSPAYQHRTNATTKVPRLVSPLAALLLTALAAVLLAVSIPSTNILSLKQLLPALTSRFHHPTPTSFNMVTATAPTTTTDITPATNASTSQQFPTLFVSHGGGPSFFLDQQPSRPDGRNFFNKISKGSHSEQWFRQVAKQVGVVDGGKYGKPKAIVVVTAHWEVGNGSSDDGEVRVSTQANHKELLYDYGGFPAHTYAPHFTYPAPGQPQLANKIVNLINSYNKEHAGQPQLHAVGEERNADHGVFIPLKLMFPEADVPVVAVSINRHYNPEWHMALGRALAPLRNEQVLVMGSGYIVHNLRDFGSDYTKFVEGISQVLEDPKLDSNTRLEKVALWDELPQARNAHPQEDHLVPLFAIVGAANGTAAKGLNSQWKQDLNLQSFLFES